jgi:branched-chain amino acid transport system ATP-binding protein
MEALRIEGLSKSFGGVLALSEVSFAVSGGEKLAIIGPNGAGKTTLLNLINGQLSPTGGRIIFFGQDITALSTHFRARLGMARAFQLINLFPGLTTLENILLALGGTEPGRVRLFRPATTYKKLYEEAEKFLNTVDLWPKRNELVRNISYGEQRKMEIGLGLVTRPKLLLLDEPNCGLSTAENSDLIQKLANLGEGIPIVIVSHDMDLVFGIADRVMVLHQGRVIADGLPKEIEDNPEVKEVYTGIAEGWEIAPGK